MSATTCTSLTDLADHLLDQTDSHIWVERHTSSRVATAFLAKAKSVVERGERARIVCVDEISQQQYLDLCYNDPTFDPAWVTTVRDLCLEIISDASISHAIGRKARVLDENEHDVLLEDMKVSGLKAGRLREMLKFFFKSICDCENEQEGWLITSEEQQLYAILEANLEIRQALLPCELPGKAYQGMIRANTEIPPQTILCDDFGTLSKAAQRLLEHLATSGLIIAGTTEPAKNANEEYPFYEGFTYFPKNHPDAYCLTLEREEHIVERVSQVCFDPSSEFAFIAEEVSRRLSQGTDPREILIATPNSTWKRNISKTLEAKGVVVAEGAAPTKIKGDPRSVDKCADLKLAAFLKLYKDPQDIVALRSWLGLGDWLLRSDAFLELMAYAEEHSMDATAALSRLRSNTETADQTILFKKFVPLLNELEECRDACAKPLSREEAIALFKQHNMPLHQDMHTFLGDDPSRADIEALALQAFQPRPIGSTPSKGVVIDTYRRCHGRHASILFITGLINGFLPAPDAVDDLHSIDHKTKAIQRDRLLFNDLEATASNEIIYSYFQQDLLENTAVMNMQTSRVFIKDGERYARITPSEFVEAK